MLLSPSHSGVHCHDDRVGLIVRSTGISGAFRTGRPVAVDPVRPHHEQPLRLTHPGQDGGVGRRAGRRRFRGAPRARKSDQGPKAVRARFCPTVGWCDSRGPTSHREDGPLRPRASPRGGAPQSETDPDRSTRRQRKVWSSATNRSNTQWLTTATPHTQAPLG